MPKQIEPRAAAVAPKATNAIQRKAAINKALAARCPTPGKLSRADLLALAGGIAKASVEWQRVVGEYKRMTREARACRGKY